MAADCATCGDPQSQHKGGRGGCRHCEFGCGEYVPDETADAAETERVLTAVAEVCEDQAEKARVELGQPSASERLREVERERDEWHERSSHFEARVVDQLSETVKAQRELAAARQEIERLAEDVLQCGLALDSSREELEQLRADLAQAEARGPHVDDLIFAAEAQHCPPCGWTSGYETHPHPTIPVRVVIHRTQGARTK